jgi:DNA-binding GntR family transcriptional regulator
MGVVREALSRLVSQGLVEAEPQHGFRVVPISGEDLAHLTEARCAIEPLVLRDAIEHGDLAWEGDLLSAHHRLARTAQMEPGDPRRFTEDWAAAHAAFHEALLSGCPNPRLRALAGGLRESAELYRRWSVPLGHDDDRDIAHEHASLLRAALDREADEAAALLAEHMRRTSRVLMDGHGEI